MILRAVCESTSSSLGTGTASRSRRRSVEGPCGSLVMSSRTCPSCQCTGNAIDGGVVDFVDQRHRAGRAPGESGRGLRPTSSPKVAGVRSRGTLKILAPQASRSSFQLPGLGRALRVARCMSRLKLPGPPPSRAYRCRRGPWRVVASAAVPDGRARPSSRGSSRSSSNPRTPRRCRRASADGRLRDRGRRSRGR